MDNTIIECRPVRKRARRAFTLIEALIALIMFGIIMSALSFAFNTVSKAQTGSEAHQADNGSVRVIFDNLRRDIQAGYASTTDPSSVFIGGGTASSGGGTTSSGAQYTVGSPGLLTLSTSSYRIQADELTTTDSSGTGQNASSVSGSLPGQQGSSIPQSGVQLVRYDFDTTTHQFSRSVVTVPNPQLLSPTNPGDPSTTLGTDIVSVTFQFWDPTQNTWRDTWDYEQTVNAQAAASAASASAGSGGAAGSTSGGTANSTAAASTSTSSGDTSFPSAVQVTIVRQSNGGAQKSYMATFPVVAGTPFTDPSKRKNATATTAGAGS